MGKITQRWYGDLLRLLRGGMAMPKKGENEETALVLAVVAVGAIIAANAAAKSSSSSSY